MIFGLLLYLPATVPWYTLQSVSHFVLLYLHNILDTRSGDSRTCTSYSRDGRISSGNFSLSNTPWTAIRSNLAEYSLTCGYDLDTLLLHVSPLPSYCIVVLVFFLCLPLSSHKLSAFCTSVQILCDIYSSISCVISFYCHSSLMTNLLCFCCGCYTCFILAKEVPDS